MKSKVMVVLSVLLLVIGMAALRAQDSTALPVDQPVDQSDAVSQTSVTSTSDIIQTDVSQIQQSATCNGNGRGYGNGSKPQPQDGTGFGAKAKDRKYRNAKMGQNQAKGLRNAQRQGKKFRMRGKRQGKYCQNSQNSYGQGKKLRLRKRDASCQTSGL